MKFLCIFLIIVGINFSIHAQEVTYKNVQINFKQEWSINHGASGELIAFQSDTKKAFILSIHYPQGAEAGAKQLIELANVSKAAMLNVDGVKLVEENVDIALENGMTFQSNIFTTAFDKRFLMVSTLGSNAGILVITYEGEGTSTANAIREFRGIVEGLKLKMPE